MRPNTLDEYIGQKHLLAPGRPLSNAIEKGFLHSMILWGPPGTGKTTLAHLLANHAHAEIEHLSAVLSGEKEIRARNRTYKRAGFMQEPASAPQDQLG